MLQLRRDHVRIELFSGVHKLTDLKVVRVFLVSHTSVVGAFLVSHISVVRVFLVSHTPVTSFPY